MSLVIAGNDPGVSGAIAFLDVEALTLTVYDMPIASLTRTTTKKEVDAIAAGLMIERHAPTHSYIEDVAASPQMGVVSAFAFGDRFGSLRTIYGALKIPLTRVKPQQWKAALKVPADKKEAVDRACQLFPHCSEVFKVVRHAGKKGTSHFDGRAEAALIALYGAASLGFTPKGIIRLRDE